MHLVGPALARVGRDETEAAGVRAEVPDCASTRSPEVVDNHGSFCLSGSVINHDDILEDRVVGVWRDELDVEYARIYELDRG